uniref:BTB domain-containing protein n=1 Tax=Mycena chlorophos TaxID=658473 RepID=A0ABQ0LIF0_MYCCL|nr:predicted protein [Mycena chlorophos]
MSLEKLGDDVWTPSGVATRFKIDSNLGETPQSDVDSASGYGRAVTCGLGWSFTGHVGQATQQFLSPANGASIPTSSVSLFFDVDPIRGANFGRLSISVESGGVIVDTSASCTVELRLPVMSEVPVPGYAGELIARWICEPGSTFVVTVIINLPNFPGMLPRSMDPKIEDVLRQTTQGRSVVDIKFYAFNRRAGEGRVTDPAPVFAKASLLEGYSDSLDDLISGRGFSEGQIVELGRHEMDPTIVEEYDYSSDSDLEDEDSDASSARVVSTRMPFPETETDFEASGSGSASSAKAIEPSSDTLTLGMGRAIIIRGTAFKTWQALIHYLYTNKIVFSSTSGKAVAAINGVCSPKSMYRLADKLGLEDLKAQSFAAIKTRLSTKTVVRETFSAFTSYYAEIQDAHIAFLLEQYADIEDDLDLMLVRVAAGEFTHCADVLRKIVSGRRGALALATVEVVGEFFAAPDAEVAPNPTEFAVMEAAPPSPQPQPVPSGFGFGSGLGSSGFGFGSGLESSLGSPTYSGSWGSQAVGLRVQLGVPVSSTSPAKKSASASVKKKK